mmetsp:Transcript_178248/g.571391  ORF Transcript_178248/g.571391 Transcript_178248/m.571391 type:complete len:202 (-) Transcript_178248:607-1212(-)
MRRRCRPVLAAPPGVGAGTAGATAAVEASGLVSETLITLGAQRPASSTTGGATAAGGAATAASGAAIAVACGRAGSIDRHGASAGAGTGAGSHGGGRGAGGGSGSSRHGGSGSSSGTDRGAVGGRARASVHPALASACGTRNIRVAFGVEHAQKSVEFLLDTWVGNESCARVDLQTPAVRSTTGEDFDCILMQVPELLHSL